MDKRQRGQKLNMLSGKCEIKNCDKDASHIGSFPESGIIDMCSDCYNRLYKK